MCSIFVSVFVICACALPMKSLTFRTFWSQSHKIYFAYLSGLYSRLFQRYNALINVFPLLAFFLHRKAIFGSLLC